MAIMFVLKSKIYNMFVLVNKEKDYETPNV